MMTHRHFFLVLLALQPAAVQLNAGTIFYAPIPATQSDANCGISTQNGYTSAVDGGNTRGQDRVVNAITLYALAGSGQSATADNCTLNALSGSLSNGGGKAGSIQADGTLGEVLSDMTFNNGAADNSQQEIVLDPESLEAGTTYDLRIYICNSSGQNRQVNLSFVGDGQAAVETGWFNEDDARTSAGGFKEANQVYYIDYRYTWDGDSTPGITITQRSGAAPFCLYALTNQTVAAGAAAAQGGAAEAEDQGADTGLVNAESDEVGVASDDFYTSDSLNSNGRWVEMDKWGKCWQPTTVTSGWSPYTNGSWRECDDCGWTFVSDEPWAWACYHYGRWAKVRTGCGWAWVPGRVWAASWVSWRRGRDESCSCVGWAPLPPEASCRINVGISNWVDRTCDIGPEYYTFVNVRDFGSDSYSGCGCLYERSRNVTIITETVNITNIYFNRNVTYCGGPDFNWCNERIRRFGGKEVTKIYVNRVDNPGKIRGGKFSHLEGNQLALLSPRVHGEKNPQHAPKVAERVGADKIDKGWAGVKDKKLERQLRNHIAQESKGKDPNTAKATLPSDVAEKVAKHHKGGKGAGGELATQGAAGGNDQHPGGKGNKKGLTTPGGVAGANATQGGTVDQHPGGKGKHKGQEKLGNTAAGGGASGGANATGFDQHPGGKGKHKGGGGPATETLTTGGSAQGSSPQTGGGGSGKGKRHPGESTKNATNAQSGGGNAPAGAGSGTGASTDTTQGGGGSHGGKHRGKGRANQPGGATTSSNLATQENTGPTGGGGGAGGGGGHKNKNKGQQTQNFQPATGADQNVTGNGPSPKGHKNKGSHQLQQSQGGGQFQNQQNQQQLQQQNIQQQQQQGQGGPPREPRGKRRRGSPSPGPQ